MGPVATLAAFLADAEFGDLPPLAIDHAKMALTSTIASAAAGRRQRSASIVRDIAVARHGLPEATVWFDGGTKIPAVEAARVNTMRSDAAACDDSDFRTLAHTGTAVSTVALAIGELMRASGSEVLAAIVCGYEASGRFGEATAPGLAQRGFHPAILGGFGGAASAAKLLGLTPTQWIDALALASASAAGLLAGTSSWAREYQAGGAVSSAVNAALAAQRGYHVPEDLIDGEGGFLATIAGATNSAALTADLGGDWDIATDLGIKLRPGGYPFAAAVEAAINAACCTDVPAEHVARIAVSGPSIRELVGPRHPENFIEAIHSLAFYVAAGVADREFSWEHVSDDRLNDPQIRRLLDVVEVDTGPGPDGYSFAWGATVTITTSAGATATATVDAPWGSARRGIEWVDVERKLRTLMSGAGHDIASAEGVLTTIHHLESVAETGELTAQLEVAPR